MGFANEKVPAGVSAEEWHKVYNSADSRYSIYHKKLGIFGKELKKKQYAARVEGRTHLLAHKLMDVKVEKGEYLPGKEYRSPAVEDAIFDIQENDADFDAQQGQRARRGRTVKYGCRIERVKKAKKAKKSTTTKNTSKNNTIANGTTTKSTLAVKKTTAEKRVTSKKIVGGKKGGGRV